MLHVILIRHAKVDISNPWIYSSQLKEYLELYNSSPILKEPISKELRKLIENSDILATSELLRAKKTLKLFNKEPDFTSPLFNESPLPYAKFKLFKLPTKVWIIIYRIAWLFGFSRNANSIKQERVIAKKVALKLLSTRKNITLVGHGVKNYLIAKELKRLGCFLVKKSANKNLGYYSFNKVR